jgi:hypothetical protein
MDLHDVLLLRKAHTLGTSMIRNGELLGDSDLTASQLSWKRDFMAANTRTTLQDAQTLYAHCVKKRGQVDKELVHQAAKVWKSLLEKLPVQVEDDDEAIVASADGSETSPKSATKNSSPRSKKAAVDETLFQGLHEFMNKDEQIFVTELFTSGEVKSLAQAAMILHGIMRLSMSGKAAAIAKQNEQPMSKYETQKHIDYIAKTKMSFPLPNHMPGYFLIPSFTKQDKFMSLADEEWDGSITPPARSQRVFDQVYRPNYQPPIGEYPKSVVIIQAVRGPVGRMGLRSGDVITHVNDVEWTGPATDLKQYIYETHTKHPREEIAITVNCSPATAIFLKVRQQLLQRSREGPQT